MDRYVIRDGIFCEHHARRMGRCIARHSFQLHGGIEQVLDRFIRFISCAKLWVQRNRAFYRGRLSGRHRNHFGDDVYIGIRNVEHPSDISYGAACRHRTKCNDLRDTVLPVFAHDVIDYFFPSFIAEIDIEIRHADSFGIQEAFKRQVVF